MVGFLQICDDISELESHMPRSPVSTGSDVAIRIDAELPSGRTALGQSDHALLRPFWHPVFVMLERDPHIHDWPAGQTYDARLRPLVES